MSISTSIFSIYFGGQQTSYIDDSLHGYSQQEIMQLPGYKEFCDQNGCEKLVILEQVHGNSGYQVLEDKDANITPYSVDGDYIISTISGVAFVIETADCVPVVLVDTVSGVVANAHAGWRGAVSGVVTNAVRDMLACGSKLENVQAYFGPAARSCCYEVSPDFLDKFESGTSQSYFNQRDSKLYFDNTLFIISQLEKLGIAQKNIVAEYAVCTVCSEVYCSFRRQGDLNLRQMTIVALK